MRRGAEEKTKIEYRYFEMPPGGQALFLTREEIYKEKPDVMHFHNVMEIGYCYKGSGIMYMKDEKIPFCEGTFTIIPKKFPHVTISGENTLGYWKYLFVDSDGFLRELYGENSLMGRELAEKTNARFWTFKDIEERENADLILQLISIMKEQGPLYKEEFKGLMLTLLVRMAARAGGEEENGGGKRETEAGKNLYPSRNSMIISKAVDYISKVPERPVKIDELAKMCHISETHFRRVFGECMQMTPVEYINRVRVRGACDALERTNKSVGDIAAETGFGTVSTFNRNFRQITGVSPQQWRKNAREYGRPKEDFRQD
ncbi:MAG: AraC family transcriptional regulator [Clostridium sp.]|nr:AraC family transcriptional regulator [Clostridium sp.]